MFISDVLCGTSSGRTHLELNWHSSPVSQTMPEEFRIGRIARTEKVRVDMNVLAAQLREEMSCITLQVSNKLTLLESVSGRI